MKVMVLVKASKSSEAGVMPSTAMMAAMGKFNEKLVAAGIMLDGDGLRPTSAGARVRFSGKDRTLVQGPFKPVTEQLAGYWIWQVKSLAEAIKWLKRCPNPHEEVCEVEIRPYFEAADFGEAFTPELQAQEQKLAKKVAKTAAKAGKPAKAKK